MKNNPSEIFVNFYETKSNISHFLKKVQNVKDTLDEPYTLFKYYINYETHYQKGYYI